MPEFIYGITHYCLEEGHIKLLGDLYQKQNKVKFLINSMHHHGGHFVGDKIAQKILQSGFYWPTLFRD